MDNSSQTDQSQSIAAAERWRRRQRSVVSTLSQANERDQSGAQVPCDQAIRFRGTHLVHDVVLRRAEGQEDCGGD